MILISVIIRYGPIFSQVIRIQYVFYILQIITIQEKCGCSQTADLSLDWIISGLFSLVTKLQSSCCVAISDVIVNWCDWLTMSWHPLLFVVNRPVFCFDALTLYTYTQTSINDFNQQHCWMMSMVANSKHYSCLVIYFQFQLHLVDIHMNTLCPHSK